MPRTSDLVRDSKLQTRFHPEPTKDHPHPEYTQHFFCESGRDHYERTVHREELWKRVRYIGRGSYGSVWLEQCVKGQSGQKLRAVKQIPRSQQTSRPINYDLELEAISKFSHRKYDRCFVQSFGWYETAEDIFISMEYLEYGDLQDYLSGMSQLPETEVQQITFQLLEGLSFMHENGFAHRDLKPRNILIKSKLPQPWWVKIGDFGISKRAEDGLPASSTLKGTLGFIAPELLGFVEPGKEPSPRNSKAADMWSLGEIAFQMLTKEPVFGTINDLFLYAQSHQAFPSTALIAYGVSSKGQKFIEHVMMPAPEKRLTVSNALLDDWMEPYRSPGSRPSSIVFDRLQEISAPTAADPPPEPSGRWSVIETPSFQLQSLAESIARVPAGQSGLDGSSFHSGTSTQRRPDRVGVEGTYPLPNKILYEQHRIYEATQEKQEFSDAPLASNGDQEARTVPAQNLSMSSGQERTKDAEKLPNIRKDKSSLSKVLNCHNGSIWGVAFSPDGKMIVSGSQDASVVLWDAATGVVHCTLKGHKKRVKAVTFSPDGDTIASGSSDGTIKLWNAVTGVEYQTLRSPGMVVITAVAFSPDGKMIVSGSSETIVRLWDAVTGAVHHTLKGHKKGITSVAFSPDGKTIASGSSDETIKLWNAVTGVEFHTLRSPKMDVITAVAFSPDGKTVVSGSYDMTIRLWDTGSGIMRHRLRDHTGWVTAVAFSPDGKTVVSGSVDTTVRLWDAVTGTACHILRGHKECVRAVAFSPDNRVVASGSDDATLRLWDTATGE